MGSSRWLVLLASVVSVTAGCGEKEPLKGVSPEDALKRLLEGNQRYVAAKSVHPNETAERRARLAEGQEPFAIVLGCADSRVPPEVLFDQGLGDLFVVRSAGHVLDDAGLGTLEYGAEHLGVRLIVVLGHERCGAVGAAVKGGDAKGHLKYLVETIEPAVKTARGVPGDTVDNAVRANVARVVQAIRRSKPILAERAEDGKLAVVGARYDLDTGVVEVTER